MTSRLIPRFPLRRAAGLLLAVAAMLPSSPVAAGTAAGPSVVYRSPTCQCCERWVEHMRSEGIGLAMQDLPQSRLTRLKESLGLKPEQASCHTAVIEGYVVEGHVPASDVKRLLAEKPDALGLAVPKMPIGSPGMEQGGRTDPYEVLLVKKDGTTEVWSRH